MTTFTWVGGSMSAPASWAPQDPNNPVEPGAGDLINIAMNGTLTGLVSVLQANLSATLELDGTITTTGGTVLDGAHLTVKGGENDANQLLVDNGSYELDTGNVIVSTNEFVSEHSGKTADFIQKGGTHTIGGALEVASAGGTGSFELSGGTLSSNQVFVGQNSTGTFTQTGGTHTVADRIVLGVNVTSGALGTGTYTLGGTGALSMKEMFIGSDPNCHGTFNFNTAGGDAATLTVAANGGFPGLIVGGQGIGVMTQGGGTVSSTISVGFRSGGNGTCNFNAGTITTTDEKVGDAGTGTFIQNAGTQKISSNGLTVGTQAGSMGTFEFHAGALKFSGTAGIDVGAQANSTGDFQFNSTAGDHGTITTSGALTVTAGDGGTGTFEMGSGALGADLELAAQVGSEGTFTFGGGTITAANFETIGDAGTGVFTQTDGINTVDGGNLFVGNDGTGTYTLGGTGTLALTGGELDIAVGGDGVGTFNFNTTTGDTATLTTDAKIINVGVHGTAAFVMGGGMIDAKFVVGGQVGAHGSVSVTGGTIVSHGQIVGNDGGGKFTLKSGTDRITGGGDLIMGAFAAGGGTFTLKSGSLSNGGELVGYAGAGHFNQSGGSNTIAGTGSLLDLGTQTGAVGTYSLSGGSLKTILETIGDSGTGTFAQKGGTNAISGTTAKLTLGAQSGGIGSYALSKGSLTSVVETVGGGGTGKFTQTGGTNTIAGSGAKLDIATVAADKGSYFLTKGNLNAASERVGDFGTGSLKQTGATNTLTGALTIGVQVGAVGAYTLAAGKLIAASEIVGNAGTGTFSQSGGTNTISGNLTIGKSGTGTYKLTGGSLSLTGATSDIALGVAAHSTGNLSVTAGRVTAPQLIIGSAGIGHVNTGTGGVIVIAHEIDIAVNSTLNSTLGSVVVGTGHAPAAGTIGVGKDGLLKGAGSVSGIIDESPKGSVEAHGGTLTLAGDVMGGGKLLIDDGAKLTLGGADANSVVFEGAHGTLKLLHPETMTGKITGLQVGNIIDLAGIDATHAAVSHGVLTVTESNSDTLTFHIGGTLQGTRFVIKSDGHGGSDLELKSTTPAAAHPSSDHAFLTVDANGVAGYQTGHDAAYAIAHAHAGVDVF